MSFAIDVGAYQPIHAAAVRDQEFCIVHMSDMHRSHAAGQPCFPAAATVTVLKDGKPSQAAISQLSVGDMVMVCTFSIALVSQ